MIHIKKVFSAYRATMFAISFAVIGLIVLTISFAATSSDTKVFEAESATLSGAIVKQTDASASGGEYLEFGVDPSSATFPDASTTGVSNPGVLTNSGSLNITQNGTVVENLNISGSVTIRADNVTIRNSQITRQSGSVRYTIDTGSNNSNILIKDVEIDGANLGSGTGSGDVGICCKGYTARRVNIHGFRAGVAMSGNVTIEDSYIHDLLPTGSIHKEAILANGGSNYVLRGNHLDASGQAVSAALALYGDFSQIRNVVIENNLFNTSGSYCLYAGSFPAKAYPVADNVRVVNNAFGREYHAECGRYGPAAGYKSDATGHEWSGNYWHDNGELIPLSAVKHSP